MVGSSGVWRVGCMWRVEECEVECACAYGWGKDWYIYNIYTYIFRYLFMLSTNRGTPRPVDKKQHLTLKVLVVMIEKNNNRKSNSSNNRKE